MTIKIAAPLAVRKGFNFEVLRADGWFKTGDVLHVAAVEHKAGVNMARLLLVSGGKIIGESLQSVNAITANTVTGKWQAVKPSHYLAGQDELRVIYESNGDFNPAAICGNGAPPSQLETTKIAGLVSCAHCIKKIARYNARK
jgi:hypothetical protein